MSPAIVTKIFKIEVNWEARPFLLIIDSKLESRVVFFFLIGNSHSFCHLPDNWCGHGTVRLQQSVSASWHQVFFQTSYIYEVIACLFSSYLIMNLDKSGLS